MSSLGAALSIGAPSLLHIQLSQLQRKSSARQSAGEAATTPQPPATPVVATAASVNQPRSIAQGPAAPALSNSLLALLINVQGDGSAAPPNNSSQTPPPASWPSAVPAPANSNAAAAAPASSGIAPAVSAAPGGESTSPTSADPVVSDRADSGAGVAPANGSPADSSQSWNVGAAQIGQPTAAAAYTAALTSEIANSTLSIAA